MSKVNYNDYGYTIKKDFDCHTSTITVEWKDDNGAYEVKNHGTITHKIDAKDAFLAAMSLINRGYTTGPVLKLLRKSADDGYLEAQNWLGVLYKDGTYGAVQSDKKAIKYFKRAAKQGSEYAKERLKILKKGDKKMSKFNYKNQVVHHPDLDQREIEDALRIASKLSSLTDAFNQAYSYMDNRLTGNLAFTLMRQTALMGHERAQNEVGCMYKDGTHGAPLSHKKARKFFRMAEKQGSPYAIQRLKELAGAKK